MSISGTADKRVTTEHHFETHGSQPLNDNSGPPLMDDLVASAQEGNEGALVALFAQHGEKLLRIAERVVHDRCDAEEVLQEVFLTTWRKLPTFEGRSQISTWLYRVTINASLMLLRTRRRRAASVPVDERVLDLPDADDLAGSGLACRRPQRPDEQLQTAELMDNIGQAVAQLPQGLHDVFVKRYIEGKNTEETAWSLGLTTAAVKTRLHRARVLLREYMAPYLAQRGFA